MANYFVSRDFRKISVGAIGRSGNSPKRSFDEDELAELARSIRTFGVITPLTVRKTERGYELIAGERRLRAAKMAGLSTVPCYILNTSERDGSFMSVVENLQRRDLDFFEEANSLKCLIEKYGLTQQQAAEKIGKTQSAVANKLRLLKLSPETIELIREAGLSERHARALLRLPENEQKSAAESIICDKMNVEQTEKYIEKLISTKQEKPRRDILLVKDLRIFLNTLTHAAEVMRASGFDVTICRDELPEKTVVTVFIPDRRDVSRET